MEFLYKNDINTTTHFDIDSGTATVEYLLSTDYRYQYVSSGDNSDATTTSIVNNFDVTTTISRIVLMEHNLEGFRVFYNGSTASGALSEY